MAWQGTTLDPALTAPSHAACCLMRLRRSFSAAWQIVAGRSAIIGVGADDSGDDLLLSLKIQLVTSTSARESKGLNYLRLQAEDAEERVLLRLCPWSGQLRTSFASRWLLLLMIESCSMLCIHLFSTLTFAVVPWVSGSVVEAEDGC